MRISPCTPKEIYPCLKRDFHDSAVKPLEIFERLCSEGYYHIYRFFEGENFIGYTCLAGNKDDKLRLMDYFAVNPELRSNGYGSKILGLLCEYAQEQGFGIVCESENPDFSIDKNDDIIRKRRLKFYTECGAKITDVTSRVGTDNYLVLLVCGNFADNDISCFMSTLYDRFFGEQAKTKVTIAVTK